MAMLSEREAELEVARRAHQGLVKELGVVASRYVIIVRGNMRMKLAITAAMLLPPLF